MNRSMLIKTEHDLFTINGVKKIYISHHIIYKLIVEDKNKKHCIFWSFDKESLMQARDLLIEACQSEKIIVYL